MDDSKTKQVPDDSSVLVSEDTEDTGETEDTDSSASYRRFALVAFAAILGYGTVADAEAAALRVFPSGPDSSSLNVSISITIPSPTGPTQGNTTCTQGQPDGGSCTDSGEGSNC